VIEMNRVDCASQVSYLWDDKSMETIQAFKDYFSRGSKFIAELEQNGLLNLKFRKNQKKA